MECVEQCRVADLRRLKAEPSVFAEKNGKPIAHVVHVDDLLIFGLLSLIQALFEELQTKLLLKCVGVLKKEGDEGMYVGRLLRMVKNGCTWTGGEKLIQTLLQETGLQDAKNMSTPATRPTVQAELEAEALTAEEVKAYRSALGKLMYLAIDYLDLCFAVNTLARKASRPSKLDATKLKRTIRYLRGHQKVDWLFIMLEGIFPTVLQVFVDADWGGDVLTRTSTARGLAVWGICTLAGWAKLEAVIALSWPSRSITAWYQACRGRWRFRVS